MQLVAGTGGSIDSKSQRKAIITIMIAILLKKCTAAETVKKFLSLLLPPHDLTAQQVDFLHPIGIPCSPGERVYII